MAEGRGSKRDLLKQKTDFVFACIQVYVFAERYHSDIKPGSVVRKKKSRCPMCRHPIAQIHAFLNFFTRSVHNLSRAISPHAFLRETATFVLAMHVAAAPPTKRRSGTVLLAGAPIVANSTHARLNFLFPFDNQESSTAAETVGFTPYLCFLRFIVLTFTDKRPEVESLHEGESMPSFPKDENCLLAPRSYKTQTTCRKDSHQTQGSVARSRSNGAHCG